MQAHAHMHATLLPLPYRTGQAACARVEHKDRPPQLPQGIRRAAGAGARTSDARRPKKSAPPALAHVAKPPVSAPTARPLAASMSGAPELPVCVAPSAQTTCGSQLVTLACSTGLVFSL